MNQETVHYLNMVLGAGAIILQIFSIYAILALFFGPKQNKFLDFTEKHFLTISFFIVLFSSLFSMVYSEAIGYLPCKLCWYQRIFLFPQVFLFGIALWEKKRDIVKYATPLTGLGLIISVYQNFVYYFGAGSNSLICDASGTSCYEHLVSEFGGYISIPMLALAAFLALSALLLVAHFYKKGILE